jgi:hypothetical protein
MRFFVHSGEASQETVERYDSATLALEGVSKLAAAMPARVTNENGVPISPSELLQLAEEENENDDA